MFWMALVSILYFGSLLWNIFENGNIWIFFSCKRTIILSVFPVSFLVWWFCSIVDYIHSLLQYFECQDILLQFTIINDKNTHLMFVYMRNEELGFRYTLTVWLHVQTKLVSIFRYFYNLEKHMSSQVIILFLCPVHIASACWTSLTETSFSYFIHVTAGSLMEWSGSLTRNLGFLLDMATFFMALGHYLHIWWLHGMAFHLVDAVLFLNIRVNICVNISFFLWMNLTVHIILILRFAWYASFIFFFILL